jgi:hypothetical protein|uniref:AAA domain protein n=1 Tax=Siphoviridae sp. ctJ7x27 TaxID=2827835 RepID=A0A8S5S402_9CAUD|nr:MAG TPA: AAA domain protein [Siphoviridae sp. ctJ7x27]
MNFTTTSQASANGGIKALVYGPAGMGKTMLCATLPAPVIISAESGLLSLRPQNIARVFGENAQGISYDIPVIEVKTVQDLSEAYNWFTTSQQAGNFQSIALDSLSEIAEVVLNNAKRQVKDPRQAYGELLEKMETLIRLFRDLPNKNVVMMAKMESYKEELTGVVKYGPSMPGSKLGQKLPYFFDEVFRLGVNKDQQGASYRFLQTQPDLQFEAKDRSGSLDPVEFPNLTYVFNKIIGV